jgi:hypothetical protein
MAFLCVSQKSLGLGLRSNFPDLYRPVGPVAGSHCADSLCRDGA